VTRRFLAFLLLLLSALPAAAQPRAPANNIAVALIAETERPGAGTSLLLAFSMQPRPGWHGYWINPGDAGAPPRVDWQLPPGVTAEPLLYPVPERLSVAGLVNYVYKGDYAYLAPLRLPAGLAPGTRLPIRARIDYLACTDEICVPEQAEVATEVTIGGGKIDAARRARFDRWLAALPRPLGAEARFEQANGRLRIAIPLPAAAALDAPYFFPLAEAAIAHSAPQRLSRRGDLLIVEAEAGRDPPADRIEGVLRTGPGAGLALAALPGAVPPAGTPVPDGFGAAGTEDATFGAGTLLLALAGALLGGLILNVMPCVFPILSLKALSLARAGGDAGAARREALAYAAGVILVCLALGGALLALRAGGTAVGWAFQLQEPRVILLLLLLVTAIALSLAGLYRLPAIGAGEGLARRGGTAGAFWTGALAAFVATPCTGPFMGAALGAALVLPAAAALAVFGGLGLGLALPFLLLGFVPVLRRRLPRPGPWMVRFQRILSVPMFVTALGLAWILGRQAGVDGMTLGLAAALALGLGLWWWGASGRRLGLALGLAAAAAGLLLVRPGGAMPPVPGAAESGLAAEPFSAERLAALRAEGRGVFLYFTADWCLTCKVNERTVLDRDAVAAAFRARQVAVLVGDWTRADPEIGRFLAAHGRSGVPLYLYYPPGGAAPVVLPQILTVDTVTEAVAG
jgi:DsbC/DsbD-like thiol-disulfide interchange protein/cytochrome c biogenesis protein CcdA